MRIASAGHAAFAVVLIVLGILGLTKGEWVTVWQPMPQRMAALAYICATICLVTGIGLLWRRSSAVAARVLLGYLLLWLLLLRVPGMLLAPNVEYWWAASQTAAMAAAAWALYVWFATGWDSERLRFATGESGLRCARVLYGLALIPFGLAHFLYAKQTAALVPAWLPWHFAWVYFTGGALIAAGLAVLFGVYARLAAALSALEIGGFTLVVWIPIVAAGSKDPSQWSETVVSVTLTAAACVVADSYRDVPWLVVRKRRRVEG